MADGAQHVPVLLQEVMENLNPQAGDRLIDCTLGGGGHTAALLDRSRPDGQVLALDADPDAIERARARLADFGERVIFVHSNFSDLYKVATAHGFDAVDGVLIDLGLSSDQLASTRGFSFQHTGALDMRFDPAQLESAADIVNTLNADELADLIYEYGEERLSRRIARAIVAARPIHTAERLAEVIAGAIGRRGRLHPATRTFQALRIAVNDELGALRSALPAAVNLLKPGGRLAVISFHSLEDRIVKQFMRDGAQARTLRLPHRKPIAPREAEIEANPRARSARLRVAEKI
jgi:16S rRNA (cytosine1402-N4)-methyltransferase